MGWGVFLLKYTAFCDCVVARSLLSLRPGHESQKSWLPRARLIEDVPQVPPMKKRVPTPNTKLVGSFHSVETYLPVGSIIPSKRKQK